MGKRSTTTTKGGRSMNPTDQFRKLARRRELKKNKKQRKIVREMVLKMKDPKMMMEEISRIDLAEIEAGPVTVPTDNLQKERRKKLKETLERVFKLYEREDPSKHAELKRIAAEFEQKRQQSLKQYHTKKQLEIEEMISQQQKQLSLPDIPLPSTSSLLPMDIPLPSTDFTSSIPLPSQLADGMVEPRPEATAAPVPPTRVLLPIPLLPAGMKPPGPPPGQPPKRAFVTTAPNPLPPSPEALSAAAMVLDGEPLEDISSSSSDDDSDSEEEEKGGRRRVRFAEAPSIKEFEEESRPSRVQQNLLRLAGQEVEKVSGDTAVAAPEAPASTGTVLTTVPLSTRPLPPLPAYPPGMLPPGPPPGMSHVAPRALVPVLTGLPAAPPHLLSLPRMVGVQSAALVMKPPESGRPTKGYTSAVITAKPQLKNIQAEVTKLVPTSVRVKRDLPPALLAKQRRVPDAAVAPTASTVAKLPPTAPAPTKDDVYAAFMDEIHGLL